MLWSVIRHRKSRGAVAATFSVPWQGTSDQVTFAVTVDGSPIPLGALAAWAGPSEDVPGQAVLYLVGEADGNRTVVCYVALPEELVVPGTIPVGTTAVESALVILVEGVQEPEAVYFASGTMVLDSGSAAAGSQWEGSVDLVLWSPPWM